LIAKIRIFYKSIDIIHLVQSDLPEYIKFALCGTVFSLILIRIPMVGSLFFLPLSPLYYIYDFLLPQSFSIEAGNATFNHSWISFPWYDFASWFHFGLFFFLVSLLVGTFRQCHKNKKIKSWVLVVVLSFIFLLSVSFFSKAILGEPF
jgi:hypothetical protein